jgi:HSP20 family protein
MTGHGNEVTEILTHGVRNEEARSMLMRFDPFREFDRLSQQGGPVVNRPAVMTIDAYRHGDQFVIHFDLPGVETDSIELTVEKNVLSVRAERRWQPAEGDEVLANERPQGAFSRQLFLGDGLDTDRISARYENGVLTVTIPVAEKAKPRKVPIAARSSGAQPIEAESKMASAPAGSSGSGA